MAATLHLVVLSKRPESTPSDDVFSRTSRVWQVYRRLGFSCAASAEATAAADAYDAWVAAGEHRARPCGEMYDSDRQSSMDPDCPRALFRSSCFSFS